MLAQKITFDLMQSKLDDIRVVQGDSRREILFEGSDLDGILSYDDYTYEFDLMKSDGTFVIQTLSAGILIPSEQMEVITGTHYYSVKIKDADNELVYSGQGAFIVDDNVITEDAIESVAEVNGLIFPDDFLTVNDHVAFIDDNTVSEGSTWSSQKIQEEIDTHSHVISKTVTGNPVTFTDCASSPLVKCDVTISPIQDLHGYDKPWVGGAGKNKFDKTTYTFTSGKYVSLSTGNTGSSQSYACTESYIPCSDLAGQTITLNHIPGGNQPGMAFYDSNNDYIDGGKGEAITVPSNAVSYRFTVPIEYASGDDVQIEIGSTATAYESYSNICPISGYSSVGVNVAGKNLVEETIAQANINASGVIETGGSSANFNMQIAKVKQGVTYVITSDEGRLVCGFYTTKPIVGSISYNGQRIVENIMTFTAPIDGYVAFRSSKNEIQPQLEIGYTASEYVPYNPKSHTYTISLGDTYYSGQIDAVKGVLVVDRVGVDIGSLNWIRQTSEFSYAYFYVNIPTRKVGTSYLLSSAYSVVTSRAVLKNGTLAPYNTSSSNAVAIRDDAYSDVASFKTALSGQMIIYELATPIEIPLTPTVISSLLGNNAMWTDGDNLSVEYITAPYQPLIDSISQLI